MSNEWIMSHGADFVYGRGVISPLSTEFQFLKDLGRRLVNHHDIVLIKIRPQNRVPVQRTFALQELSVPGGWISKFLEIKLPLINSERGQPFGA